MPIACRVLPHEAADGPANMALDEALMDAVAADPSRAALRTYAWSPATLSLGYFQSRAEAATDPRWRDVPLVRRATGGGAIWHDRELTYAVIVPAGHPLARRGPDLYRAVHGAIAGVLRGAGLDVARRGDPEPGQAVPPKPFLCFLDRDPEDLVAGGHKVVGSAQRRRAGAVLQHGSVLLARSPTTPELPGVADLSPAPPDPASWSARVAAAILDALGLVGEPGEAFPRERLAAVEIARRVYRSPNWTDRR